MKSFPVVDFFEKIADLGPRFGQIPVFVAVNLLTLQGFHKGFAGCVVPRISFTRHADDDAVFLQQTGVIAAGILRATVGVMDQTGFNHPL